MTEYPGDVTVEEEITNPFAGRPHVVILGAGASRAAFPDGDRNGRKLPVMADIVETVGLGDVFDRAGVEWRDRNFESLYGALRATDGCAELCTEIETRIADYFRAMELRDEPTLYDYFVLSLRPKDVIATFNWDPFLYDACRRNRVFPLPQIIYLHGNVRIGYCAADRRMGLRGSHCSQCGQSFMDSKLLYPVEKKNYSDDPFISSGWESLGAFLRRAFVLTVFGYSAPVSDVDAIDLMKAGWGAPETREFEQVELINTRPERELVESWDPFIHTHHYEIHQTFQESILGQHPRRSIEIMWNTLLDARWVDSNPPPQGVPLPELHEWFESLVEAEERASASRTR